MSSSKVFFSAISFIACVFTPLHAANEKPLSLFDGKSLNGWDFTEGVWSVEDGAVTAGSHEKKFPRNEFICTKKSYANFELKLSIKCSGNPKTGLINSGIQIRSARLPNGGAAGYQIDCGEGWFGKIYDEHRRALIYPKPIDEPALLKAIDTHGWNKYRILADGPRIQVWINGVKASDYTETNPNIPLNGVIAPQIHSGGHVVVQFKEITIRELPPTPNAPTWKSLGGIEKALQKAKQPVKHQPRSAKQQEALFRLPEGYEIELVAQESPGIGKFISVYFDQRGRMWTQTALEYPVDGNESPAAAEALYKRHGKDKILVYPREALNKPLPPGGLTNPTVFADGLAIPLGILPWGQGDSCYAMHGPDLLLLTDTNKDGKSDQKKTLLTGFGVQDSHLFPHQFTRAPNGDVWMAQGLFNDSKVKQPGSQDTVHFPKCSMARMRPDGSGFEITSVGPNNIWGLFINGEGETFIQEANDYGYALMPFHDYTYYPGGMSGHRKSYQPALPPTAKFRMGGTGLSGLALLENGPAVDPKAAHTAIVANPITNKLQVIGMHRQGAGWALHQRPDLLTCLDQNFRPVALTQGPDGCIYVVDWYNKIISHNEVPRNHPDRDKSRGRIWRIKPSSPQTPGTVPDFTALKNEQLLSLLGRQPTATAHLARETLTDRRDASITASLQKILTAPDANDGKRIQALWALTPESRKAARTLLKSPNRNVRRELARLPEFVEAFSNDPDHEVRFAAIQTLAKQLPGNANEVLPGILGFAKPTLNQSDKPVGEAYYRAFERFLIRRFLEQHPALVSTYLDSPAAANLPIEGRVLAALSLQPKDSAALVASLLPQLDRAPNNEELMRLAQFPSAPGCGESLRALLSNPVSRKGVVTQLIAQKTKLDPTKITPLLEDPARAMLKSDGAQLAVALIGAFNLKNLEPDLVTMIQEPVRHVDTITLLRSLKDLQSHAVDVFVILATAHDDPLVRNEALATLGASKAKEAPAKILSIYPKLGLPQQRQALTALSMTKAGAKALVTALQNSQLPKEALDGPTAERLSKVLGDDPALTALMSNLEHVFHDVLRLNGTKNSCAKTNITLKGPFTVETWVKLDPGIDNNDGLLGAPNAVDMNFFGSTFRVYSGGVGDVAVSKNPISPNFWTHLAVTRDTSNKIRIYTNGELDAVGSKALPGDLSGLNVGMTTLPPKGTQGDFAEYRIWSRARSEAEIRGSFDRSFADSPRPKDLIFYSGDKATSWGPLQNGARIAKTTDAPPLLTKAESEALDTKFKHFMQLGARQGNMENGKVLSALCLACHVVNGKGNQIGPELSGAGAMGLEGVLRNILTPNAAMESGYRIFRVELKSGDLIDAFFVSENKNAIVIRQPGGSDQRIEKKDVASTNYIRRSLMPEGLLDGLNDEQVTDLLSYLMTLK